MTLVCQMIQRFHIFATQVVLAFLALNCQLSVAAAPQESQHDFTDQQLEFFESKVRPILVERCGECHSGGESEGGLSLQSRKSILRGGDTGPGIIVGKPHESVLIDAINYGDYEMPPESKLPQKEIDILTQWVADGAPWPKESDVDDEKREEFNIQQRAADHWCWDSVVRPQVPAIDSEWANDPLDHFIYDQVTRAGLKVAPNADRATLLRRICFDLIGLPPTKEQIQHYVIDRTLSLEQVVDQLLASPQFGERWARHWMDLVRYAETCGHEFDYPIPDAFRYRDYLIRAFNEDVPYDQFVIEHLAGDLIRNPRRHPKLKFNESILGTGFWFLGEATHGPVDVKGDEAGRVDNQIDVMTKTFLGLTVACARCHDHKFDAISTKDYYALSGFLQSSRRQQAMLDEGAKIEASFNSIRPLAEKSNEQLKRWSDSLSDVDASRFASYLEAAINIERSDPKWFAVPPQFIQGETMQSVSHDSGVVEPQRIKATTNFRWQGEQQLWWRDAKMEGQKWSVKFKTSQLRLPKLAIQLTVARDYGAVNIYLDDVLVAENVDCYSPQLGTKRVELGQHELANGEHTLRFELIAANENAIKRNMIGIDFLEINEQKEGVPERLSVDQTAQNAGLDATVLQQFIKGLQDPSIQQAAHPLNSLYPLLNGTTQLKPSSFDQWAQQVRHQTMEAKNSRESAVKFADFDSPDHGWFRTGFAFDLNDQDMSLIPGQKPEVLPPGVIQSGRFGGPFYGVIRSPTFEITHEKIHYRIRSQSARIRLIIDGFVMDEYNGLLFVDADVKKATHPQFAWRTQSGDIKKYLGHRAHIEIIDHNNGFAAIDEIWFSNGSGPKSMPSELSQELAAEESIDDLNSLCLKLSNHVGQSISDSENSNPRDRAQLLSWILAHDLSGALIDGDESDVGLQNKLPVKSSSATALAAELKESLAQIEKSSKKTPKPILAPAMTDGSGENEFVFVRGNHKITGVEAKRQFLEALVGDDSLRFSESSGSGRMELARQITDPKNPLTSRVMVNRIWQHLTGKGIVATVDNFGVLGKKPTNQALLDYLADEFVNDNWSVKRMIRRIVLSSTYQMSSKPNPAATEIDPENDLLHRARIRRLEGETIRDAILSVSGELDPKMYGRSIPVYLTPFMQGRGRPGKSGPVDGSGRRSVYVEVRRNFLSPMMLVFDTPIPFNTTGQRNQSNVPAQALILMNDPFVIDQANKWAVNLVSNHASANERIDAIYVTAFGRQPTDAEKAAATKFIETQSVELGKAQDDPLIWQDLCHVIFNVKEFIYIK